MKKFLFTFYKIILILLIIYWSLGIIVINLFDYPDINFLLNLKCFIVFFLISLSLYFTQEIINEKHAKFIYYILACAPLILAISVYIYLFKD